MESDEEQVEGNAKISQSLRMDSGEEQEEEKGKNGNG